MSVSICQSATTVPGAGLCFVCSGCCDAGRQSRCGFVASWAGQAAVLVADHGARRSLGSHLPSAFPPLAQRGAKHAGSLCGWRCYQRLLGALSGRPPPARLGRGQKIVAGSHNIRTEEGKKQPAGLKRPRQFLFSRAEANITLHLRRLCN